MTADLDTRCGELYASGDELLPAAQPGSDGAARGELGGSCSRSDSAVPAGFAASREQFESLLCFLDGTDAAGLSHAELEEHLDRDGRELLRRLLDDHLALRAVREQRLDEVVGDEGVARGRVESGHRPRARDGVRDRDRGAAGVPGARRRESASGRRGVESAGRASLPRVAQAHRAGGCPRQLPGRDGRGLAADRSAAGQTSGRGTRLIGGDGLRGLLRDPPPGPLQARRAAGALGRREGDRDAIGRAAHACPGQAASGPRQAQPLRRSQARPQTNGRDRRGLRRHASAAHSGRHPPVRRARGL